MKEPAQTLPFGTRIRTLPMLESTRGMLVAPCHLDARRASTNGRIAGIVGGHGGDVYWVDHLEDDALAAYCFTEFDLIEEAK